MILASRMSVRSCLYWAMAAFVSAICASLQIADALHRDQRAAKDRAA